MAGRKSPKERIFVGELCATYHPDKISSSCKVILDLAQDPNIVQYFNISGNKSDDAMGGKMVREKLKRNQMEWGAKFGFNVKFVDLNEAYKSDVIPMSVLLAAMVKGNLIPLEVVCRYVTNPEIFKQLVRGSQVDPSYLQPYQRANIRIPDQQQNFSMGQSLLLPNYQPGAPNHNFRSNPQNQASICTFDNGLASFDSSGVTTTSSWSSGTTSSGEDRFQDLSGSTFPDYTQTFGQTQNFSNTTDPFQDPLTNIFQRGLPLSNHNNMLTPLQTSTLAAKRHANDMFTPQPVSSAATDTENDFLRSENKSLKLEKKSWEAQKMTLMKEVEMYKNKYTQERRKTEDMASQLQKNSSTPTPPMQL